MKILKELVKEDKLLIGVYQQIPCAENTEALCVAGCDFIVYDMEHTSATMKDAYVALAVAAAYDVPMLIRVNEVQQNLIEQALDIGAQGVIVPTVETVEQAEMIVKSAKYAPMGYRGCCQVPPAFRWIKNYNPDTYTDDANKGTFVCALIETPLGFQNLPEILKVEGLDAVQLGGGDLAVRMCMPRSSDEVQSVIQRGKEQLAQSDKLAMPMITAANAKALVDEGIKIAYKYGSDIGAIRGISQELKTLRAAGGIE